MTANQQDDGEGGSFTPEQIVRALDLPDGGSTEKRPVHTVGIAVTGSFMPSDVAKDYCIAEHFRGPDPVRVTARFSNGVGLVEPHDGWNDVRGLAVKFHLSGGVDTDLIAMTLPEFFAPTIPKFMDLAKNTKPREVVPQTAWQKLGDMLRLLQPMRDPAPGQTESAEPPATDFADTHPYARLPMFHASQLGAPVSYVREAYHAVHTFVVTGPGPSRTRRHVRFSWIPVAGIRKIPPTEYGPDQYLREELRERLKDRPEKEPARFQLMMMIGEDGDDFADSSRSWPPHRARVVMGMLTLDKVAENWRDFSEKISFNPGRLTDGIGPSDDPVLLARFGAYEWSRNRRKGDCPFRPEAKP